MSKDKILYEGKAKTIIKGPRKHTLIQRFKDDATAYNKKKHKIFKGKGALNNRISEFLMSHLKSEKMYIYVALTSQNLDSSRKYVCTLQ